MEYGMLLNLVLLFVTSLCSVLVFKLQVRSQQQLGQIETRGFLLSHPFTAGIEAAVVT
jgi:hypothetical protein